MAVPPPPPRRRADAGAPDAADAAWSTAPPPPPPSDPATRAARRAAEQTEASAGANGGGRRRTIAIAVGVLVVLIAGGAAAILVSGGGSSGPEFTASTSVKLTAGTTSLEKISVLGGPAVFPTDVKGQILSSVGAYVDNSIVKPLRAGAALNTAIAAEFDPAAVARLAAGDRAILVDEGLPKALGKIDVTTPPVALSALVDPSGKLLLVTATVDLRITAQAKTGIVKIERAGTLVFALDSSGAWKITGWTVHVNRTGPGIELPTTTTPAASTTVVTK